MVQSAHSLREMVNHILKLRFIVSEKGLLRAGAKPWTITYSPSVCLSIRPYFHMCLDRNHHDLCFIAFVKLAVWKTVHLS